VVVRIAVGSDHAGFSLKTKLAEWLAGQGYQVVDVGTRSEERVDYPSFGFEVARRVAGGDVERGVVVCGSGQGICMSVNRMPGARGAIIRDEADALITRQHNDANVACFGARVTPVDQAIAALNVFLTTDFDGGRHEARVEQLDRIAGEA
jgi:ribose 5-phosphate isomerase B